MVSESVLTAGAPRFAVVELGLFERDVRLRLPFRFGAFTLTGCPQAFARVRIRLEDGREGRGVAAELLAPKWFDKTPGRSNDDNIAQLRTSLAIAADRYAAATATTAFGLHADGYRDQMRDGAARDLNPLVAGYGPALLDKAVLDALCRATGTRVADAVARNLPGVAVTDLTPDLAPYDLDGFLASLRMSPSIQVRHTVGLADPIAGGGAVDDGLPNTLAEVIDAYGHRAFKLKLGGEVASDVARLREVASVLDRIGDPYRVTLDGNEQYDEMAGVEALLDEVAGHAELGRLNDSILFVEQPIAREATFETDVSTLRLDKALLIDEADDTLDAFPRARELGYRGVSSKSCKGLYKSLLNAARCRCWNGEGGDRCFMSAEDLSCQAGLAVQQDTALAALIGLDHVERNGHHYVDGMGGAPRPEQAEFLAAHSDMYHEAGNIVRVTIRDGRMALSSLDRVGFATSATPDFAAMRPIPGTEWSSG